MKQIRLNVFETNSSSTHSIAITKNNNVVDYPDSINFKFGEFGWEKDTLSSVDEKASYLYTAIINYASNPDDYLEYLENILNELNINAVFEKKSNNSYWECGYIDHGNELYKFLNDLGNDKTKLINFLLSPLSYILTGNDNSDTYDEEDKIFENLQPNEYWIYYKGN